MALRETTRLSVGQLLRLIGLLFEQVSISLPSFLYFPFLARYLSTDEFAQVGLGFTVYLLTIAVYDAALVEPVIVLRPSRPVDERRYIRAIWTVHCVAASVTLVFAMVIWPVGSGLWVRGLSIAAAIFAGMATTSILRRFLHYAGKTDVSGRAGVSFAGCFFSTVIGLFLLDIVTASAAALPFIMGSIGFIIVARKGVPQFSFPSVRYLPAERHIRVASANVVYSLCANLSMNVYPILFAVIGDKESIGAFRLVSVVFTPFFQMFSALYGFIAPMLVVSNRLPFIYLASVGLIACSPFAAGVAALIYGEDLAALLFGASYRDLGTIFPIALAGVGISLWVNVAATFCRARQLRRSLLILGVVQLVVTSCLAFPLSFLWGAWGAFGTYTAANLAALALGLVSLRAAHRT